MTGFPSCVCTHCLPHPHVEVGSRVHTVYKAKAGQTLCNRAPDYPEPSPFSQSLLTVDPGISSLFATEICLSKGQTGGTGCHLHHCSGGPVAAPHLSQTQEEWTEKFTNTEQQVNAPRRSH